MRFRSLEKVAGRAASFFVPLAIAAAVAGCSGDSLKNLGAATPAAGTAVAGVGGTPNNDIECPSVQVRNGASTWQEPAGGSTTDLKYQASLGQMARECAIVGDTMTVKLGVEGRLLTGPKGAAGTVDVPLRVALVEEGPKPRSVWTRFYAIPVSIQPGQSGTPFTHVEDNLSFPMPASKNLDAYVIYVGFDPQGLKTRKRPPVAHKKTAPKPAAKKQSAPRPAAPKQQAPASNGGFAPPAGGGFAPPANNGGSTFSPPASGGTFAPPPGQFSKPAGQ
ncbi:MAG TPA: hypothetical protein VNR41_08285 [Xanthobacteraceae bacterium]|jgi:hypothetical protein|nr:hypothetical protein [Xanthobacteraceae bacterium]